MSLCPESEKRFRSSVGKSHFKKIFSNVVNCHYLCAMAIALKGGLLRLQITFSCFLCHAIRQKQHRTTALLMLMNSEPGNLQCLGV